MYVEHSGWNKERGSFCSQIYFDENRTDYEAYYLDGSVAKQIEPFTFRTEDWNHDGDVYTLFGAFFSHEGRNFFWTPQEMVMSLLNHEVVKIPGLEIPCEKKPSMEEKILQSERRLEQQEIEKNQKMKMLGIRAPGEPWAR